MLRKVWFSPKFCCVIILLINWQNSDFVASAQFQCAQTTLCSPNLDLLVKQSETCGQLDIIPSDIRTFAPWAVAIYRKTKGNKWIFHTSGTIFGPSLVYSVQVGRPGRFPSDKNPGNFFIAAGINSTDFNSHDQFAQYSRISLIETQIRELDVYSHFVLYHLDVRLDVKTTPFVRDICLPFFASNVQFLDNWIEAAQSSLRIEAIQFGFALSSKPDSDTRKNLNSSSGGEKQRKLKLWKVITLPWEQCQSILRFYYGISAEPRVWCVKRNVENIRGSLPVPKILDKLKSSGDLGNDNDNEYLCHGPGSSIMFYINSNWFVVHSVGFVPSLKKLRCSSKTVYSTGFTPIKESQERFRRIFNVFKCPHGTFSCRNAQKCVNIQKVCDKINNCDDSSDEDPILCEWKGNRKKPPNSSLIFFEDNQRSRFKGKMNVGASLNPLDVNKRCPSLDFKTEGVRCRNKTLKVLDCESLFFPGREILVDCDDFHTASTFTTKSMNLFCNFEAQWTGLESIVCQKKCGIHNAGSNKKNEKYMGFTWDAAIFQNGVHVCGGSLIQDNFILSHANCVKHWIEFPGQRSDFQVFVRPLSSNYEENRQSNFVHSTKLKDVWISVINLEDKYESGIALIKLETPVLTNRRNAPMAVCSLIQPFSKITQGEIGQISTSSRQQEETRNFTVIPEKECDEILNGRSVISKNEFCAASNPAETGTNIKAQGEADVFQGTGLNLMEDKRVGRKSSSFTLLGIVSKIEDGRAVFLQVNSFSEWIIDILETNS